MNHPRRKPLRLQGYDYSQQGAYFITICVKDRRCILSKIIQPGTEADPASVLLTEIGKIVDIHLQRIPGIDAYVIMPNHIHMIVFRSDADEYARAVISNDIRSFKTIVSKRIGRSIWQTSFYDHILRDSDDYLFHLRYIETNPTKWTLDRYYHADRSDFLPIP